jgi:epsilon-lactone hydrolase
MNVNNNILSINYQNAPVSGLSHEAQKALETRVKFHDYLPAEVWPFCRDGFKQATEVSSNQAREELLDTVEEKTIAGQRVLELTPKTYTNEKKVILYLHGGAFTLGKPDHLLQVPAPVSHRTGWQVLAVDYPLAPYAGNVDDLPAYHAALNVYRELLKTYEPSEIAIMGDSAGGGMAMGIALMASDEGLPLPGALVLYQPFLDCEFKADSYGDLEKINSTVVLTPNCMNSARDAAFGVNNTELYASPYVSPINAEFSSDFPPIAIFTAERDLLREDGEMLASKLQNQGNHVFYHCGEGLWHGYQEHYKLPESEECADIASGFLRGNMTN